MARQPQHAHARTSDDRRRRGRGYDYRVLLTGLECRTSQLVLVYRYGGAVGDLLRRLTAGCPPTRSPRPSPGG